MPCTVDFLCLGKLVSYVDQVLNYELAPSTHLNSEDVVLIGLSCDDMRGICYYLASISTKPIVHPGIDAVLTYFFKNSTVWRPLTPNVSVFLTSSTVSYVSYFFLKPMVEYHNFKTLHLTLLILCENFTANVTSPRGCKGKP